MLLALLAFGVRLSEGVSHDTEHRGLGRTGESDTAFFYSILQPVRARCRFFVANSNPSTAMADK